VVKGKILKRLHELEEWKKQVLLSFSAQSSDMVTYESSSVSESRVEDTVLRQTAQSQVKRNSMEQEKLELLLEYHKTHRFLLQSLVTDLKFEPGRADLEACAKTSGQICQIYRSLHRLIQLPFSLLDLHSVFVAGFTMIYCIWVNADLYDTEMAGYLGTCSTVLYVIAEQWRSAKRYRDAFELISEKTVEYAGKHRHTAAQLFSNGSAQENGVSSSGVAYPSYATSNDTLRGSEICFPLYGQSEGDQSVGKKAYGANVMNGLGNDKSYNFDMWDMMSKMFRADSANFDTSGGMDFGGIEDLLRDEGLGWLGGDSFRQI
jgi:hypothetical protein